MSGERMSLEDAKKIASKLSPKQLEAVATIIETTEAKGEWGYIEGAGSVFEDSVSRTLCDLAADIRKLKEK